MSCFRPSSENFLLHERGLVNFRNVFDAYPTPSESFILPHQEIPCTQIFHSVPSPFTFSQPGDLLCFRGLFCTLQRYFASGKVSPTRQPLLLLVKSLRSIRSFLYTCASCDLVSEWRSCNLKISFPFSTPDPSLSHFLLITSLTFSLETSFYLFPSQYPPYPIRDDLLPVFWRVI